MGTTQAMEFAALVNDGAVSLRTAMHHHLQHNHYPPVPQSMIDPCLAAIAALVDEEPSQEIELPEGITYKGHPTAPASAIVEQHHLWYFVENAMYETEEEL